MIGETAKMLAQLDFKDNLSKGVKTAVGSVGKLGQKFGTLGKGLSTLGGNIKNLISGPLGVIGLGAGILGVGKFLEDSVGKAKEFGEAVFKVKAIIGGTTQATSQLVDVLGDYGIGSDAIVKIGGMFEKNLGNIAKNAKTAAKFQADYGVSVFDSNGKVKTFNEFLLESADIFTSKTIPQSQKAAILSKLYGRNWQELVPILSKGRAELQKTLGEGITLTDKQAKSLEKARLAGIKWDDALGDLQTMIGIELLPVITKLVNKLTRFVQDHGEEIRKFFRDAAKFAQGMGQAIQRDVLPAISKIGDIWAGVPDDLKKILIGGFVVNKLSGGAITGIFSELAKGLIKGVLGINAGVVNINAATVTGAGGVPGVPAAAAPAAGAIGVGGAVIGAGALAGLIGGPIVQQLSVDGANAELAAAGIDGKLQAMSSAWDFPALLNNLGVMIDGINTVSANTSDTSIAAAFASGATTAAKANADVFGAANKLGVPNDPAIAKAIRVLQKPRASDRSIIANLDKAITAIRDGGTIDEKGYHTLEGSIKGRLRDAIARGDMTLARKLENQLGVLHQIRNKKLAVKVTQKQAQSSSMSVRTATGQTTQGRPGFHYTRSQGQDLSRFLATGAVGLATKPMSAVFGEAGKEVFAILRNPRRGTVGGGGGTTVHVTVNIDPRRVTKKQTSSGIYKTYVAT